MLVMRDLSHTYPFRPLRKTAADQTLERSITTQPLTIQPPPLPAINGVAGSGAFLPQEPSSAYDKPLRGLVLGLLDGFDDVLVEPFVPDGAIVALDVGVLLGLTGLHVLDGAAPFLGPFHEFAADVFGPHLWGK